MKRQAEPNLAAGLARVKITKRLTELPQAGADLAKPSPKPGPKPAPGPALAVAPFDEKQAKGFQIQWSKHLKVPVEQTNSIGLRLVLIPPGEFDMGSTAEEVARLLEEGKRQNAPGWYLELVPGEAPQHHVKISKPFYLGVCEVTQAEYGQVMGQDPSKFKGDPNRPGEQVNWSDAVEFCQRLSTSPKEKATGAVYRLPTEAEWEFACRAGTLTRYSFGDAPTGLGQHAWCKDNSQGQTQPVGRLRPNAWGLLDMHGNVWEWCDNGYEPYQAGTVSDPQGRGTATLQSLRGGCWNYYGYGCRSALRLRAGSGHRSPDGGFRVVRVRSDAS